MRTTLFIIVSLFVLLAATWTATASAAVTKQLPEPDVLEEAFDEEFGDQQFPAPADDEEEYVDEEDQGAPPEEPAAEPEAAPEETLEDEQEPVRPAFPLPFRRPRPVQPPEPSDVFVGEGEEVSDEAYKVVIDLLVDASYVFNNSPESFDVTYNVHFESKKITTNASVIRGDAEINAKVKGFLAKWAGGECKLKVTVPKVPFQITVKRAGEDAENVDVSLKFTKQILETWESSCTFGDSGAKAFVTSGDPEKWFSQAITKSSPPLSKLVAGIEPGEKKTTSFVISTHTFNDPPLGNVEVSGKGTLIVMTGEALTQDTSP